VVRYHPGVRTLRAIALTSLALLAPAAARAGPNCRGFAVAGFDFGAYDPLASTAVDAAATLSYDCVGNATPVVVTFSRGASPTFNDRTLVQGAERLAYNLYVDAARTQVWGDGTEGTLAVTVPSGPNKTVPVYARLFPRQDAAVGAYSDVIVATFNF
jgi:spore coat protein U-like protein